MLACELDTLSGFCMRNQYIIQSVGPVPVLRNRIGGNTCGGGRNARGICRCVCKIFVYRQRTEICPDRAGPALRMGNGRRYEKGLVDYFDSLIEQSCRAAGISAQMDTLRAAAAKTKTKSSCQTDIQACLIESNHCNADYSNCADNADFDKFFAGCSVSASGCDQHIATIRQELVSARDSAINNADSIIDTIVASYQSQREQKLNPTKANCQDNAGREACITTVCERSMRNKCAAGFASERSMATQLCKFHDLACDTLK